MDIMTHCTDSKAYLLELAGALPHRVNFDADGNALSTTFDKTQTIRLGNETLSIMRVTAEELVTLKSFKNITVIAEVKDRGDLLASLSTANKVIYDRIYPRTPIKVTGMDGTVETLTPPPIWAKIG